MAKQEKGKSRKGEGKKSEGKSGKPAGENKLGSMLAQLRQKRGLSMQKLADATGISAAYICRIETGERRPSRDLLHSLADALLPEGSQGEKDELLVAAGFVPVNFRNFMGREDVLAIYHNLLAQNPKDFKTFIALALSLIRSYKHEQARKLIHEGMQRFDDMVQLQALMAALELSKQNFDSAITFQQEAIRHYQEERDKERLYLRLTDLLLSLGVMHFERGHQAAYRRIQYAAEGSQAAAAEQTRLALNYLKEASRVFREALDSDPEDVYILDELARVHFTIAYIEPPAEAAEHWCSSIAAFEQTVTSPAKQSLGYHALLQSTLFLALAYSKASQFDKAWLTLSIVEVCLPNYWLVHYIKACHFGLRILHEHKGKRAKASEALFNACLQALEKAVAIADSENHTQQEAAIDPDLEPIRKHCAVEFQALMKQGAAK